MANREKVVTKLASYLRNVSRKRSNSVVTADDAQKFLSKNRFRGNVNDRLSVIRSALRTPTFTPVGYTTSSRPAAKSRYITQWMAN